MQKFKITVQRTDEYEIHVDEKVWNDEELKKWSSVFWNVDDSQDLAKSLAEQIMRLGSGNGFIEGFSIVKTLRNDGSVVTQFDRSKKIEDEDYTEGLLVRVITEDEDYETEVEKIH